MEDYKVHGAPCLAQGGTLRASSKGSQPRGETGGLSLSTVWMYMDAALFPSRSVLELLVPINTTVKTSESDFKNQQCLKGEAVMSSRTSRNITAAVTLILLTGDGEGAVILCRHLNLRYTSQEDNAGLHCQLQCAIQ
ncbi:hypothetical protein MHYP_G00027110 [Metynnis hypsauchen]